MNIIQYYRFLTDKLYSNTTVVYMQRFYYSYYQLCQIIDKNSILTFYIRAHQIAFSWISGKGKSCKINKVIKTMVAI